MTETETFQKMYNAEVFGRVKLPSPLKGKYELTDCLKEGNNREVYLARGSDGRKYILKIRPAGMPDSLEREFQLMRGLSHPQLPYPIAYAKEDGKEYMVRSYIPGKNLQEEISEKGTLPERGSVEVIQSICCVLRYLHGQNPPVIHRDIKAQNVIVSPEGKCFLIDFGTARLYKAGSEEDTVFMGTQATAPPEQFGYGQTDERTDIYALGMLGRYLVSGRLEQPERGQASAAYRRIIGKCTAFDPEKRFRNVKKLERSLRFFLHRKEAAVIGTVILLLTALLAAGGVVRNYSLSVSFENSLLEQAVRQELGLTDCEKIPKRRLQEVRQVIICGKDVLQNWETHSMSHYDRKNDSALRTGNGTVSSLEELTLLPNLEKLALDYQDITDITPLEGMKLRCLSLCGNRITDITALKGMDSLEALWLEDEPVSDTDVISELTSLQELEIGGTDISSAESFSSLPLETLRMKDTLITDLTPLENMEKLRFLTAGEVDEGGMRIIQSMKRLEYLTVSGKLEDLKGFSDCKRMNMLDISKSRIISLEGVERLPRLEYFGFGYTEPESLEPLTAADSIQIAEMVGARIEDYTPLLRCKKLNTVHVGLSRKSEAQKQLKGSGITIYAWEE